MKASTPIGPSLGLNAVRLSILSGAVTAALGAPAMAQESMEIELDPFEHTVFVPGEDTRDVLVTGVKTAEDRNDHGGLQQRPDRLSCRAGNDLQASGLRRLERPHGRLAGPSRRQGARERAGFGRHNDHRDGHVEPA